MKILFLSFFIMASSFAKIVEVYDVKAQRFVDLKDFYSELSLKKSIVMGEYHYDKAIQNAEGAIIENVGLLAPEKSKAVMWEFLDYTDQEKISSLYNKVLNHEMSSFTFLDTLLGSHEEYVNVIDSSVVIKADFYGLNLPRGIKQKAMESGLESIDPSYVPEDYRLGGEAYYERFKLVMGGHVDDEKIAPYFMAQSLTDSVMARSIKENEKELNFIIAGSFHTDYFDGVVDKMDKEGLALLKIVNQTTLSDEEKQNLKDKDPKYGEYADYIVFSE